LVEVNNNLGLNSLNLGNLSKFGFECCSCRNSFVFGGFECFECFELRFGCLSSFDLDLGFD
jgi:hypothetical protein